MDVYDVWMLLINNIETLTFPVSADGNSDSNLLLSPNLRGCGGKSRLLHISRYALYLDN